MDFFSCTISSAQQLHTDEHTSPAAGSNFNWYLGFVSLRVLDKETAYVG